MRLLASGSSSYSWLQHYIRCDNCHSYLDDCHGFRLLIRLSTRWIHPYISAGWR